MSNRYTVADLAGDIAHAVDAGHLPPGVAIEDRGADYPYRYTLTHGLGSTYDIPGWPHGHPGRYFRRPADVRDELNRAIAARGWAPLPPELNRRAIVRGVGNVSNVRAYLPANYHVTAYQQEGDRIRASIGGYDRAGWTLEDYVVPRLASGLFAVEVIR